MKKLLLILVAILSFSLIGFYSPRIFVGVGGIEIFKFNIISSSSISGVLQTAPGKTVIIRWGDGTETAYSGTSDTAYSHTYFSTVSTTISIYAESESVLKKFSNTDSTISFDLSALNEGLEYIYITYFNGGGNLSSLPRSLTDCSFYGSNTISGDISGLPYGIQSISFYGSNTISGDISGMPEGIKSIRLWGNNTVYGMLSNIKNSISYISVKGYSSLTYDSYWGSTSLDRVLISSLSDGMSSGEVDQLLIDLDSNVATWIGSKIITLTESNAARTSASDAAVASLQSKGVTVTTN
jgi:hypothetical protein